MLEGKTGLKISKNPKKLKKKEDKVKSLKRGEFLTRQTKDKRQVATVWKDKRAVYNLSTCYPVTNERSNTVTRRHINEEGKWVKGDIPCFIVKRNSLIRLFDVTAFT
jgi:hypothetical protein